LGSPKIKIIIFALASESSFPDDLLCLGKRRKGGEGVLFRGGICSEATGGKFFRCPESPTWFLVERINPFGLNRVREGNSVGVGRGTRFLAGKVGCDVLWRDRL